MINPNYITHLDHIVRIIIVCTKAVNILSKSEPSPNRSPAKRVRFGNEETVRPAYEKSPKAFLIALGLFLNCIKALKILFLPSHPPNREPSEADRGWKRRKSTSGDEKALRPFHRLRAFSELVGV